MRILAAALTVFLVGCASEPRSDVGTWDQAAPIPPAAPPPPAAAVSQVELMQSLGLGSRPIEELGAIEKTFNSCALNPHVEPCATKFVTLLHFQLLCRDTEGTVNDAPVSPEPIAADDVRWNVGALKGATRTDDHGFGQIIALSDRSLLEDRVTLRLGAKFLGLTVGEITKVVLPSNFCQRR